MLTETSSQIHAKRVSEGLEDCDPSCLNATDKICTCACGGKNHGRDAKKNQERLDRLNHRSREQEIEPVRVVVMPQRPRADDFEVVVAEVRLKVDQALSRLEQIEPEEHGVSLLEVPCLGNVFREARLTALSRLEDMDVGC